MKTLCEHCSTGPLGEQGHLGLGFYVSGPFPGQHIYRCQACDERWIRSRGEVERFAWTRFAPRREPISPPIGVRLSPTRGGEAHAG